MTPGEPVADEEPRGGGPLLLGPRGARLVAGASIGAGALLVAGVLARWPWWNGAPYWRWAWRVGADARSVLPVALAALPALALVAGGLALRRRRALALALLCAGQLALTWGTFLATDAPGFLRAIVRDEQATSYWTDAARIDAAGGPLRWLDRFDEQPLAFHSTTKPPGPVLIYYAGSRLAGERGGPLLGAVLISLLAALGPAATFLLARLLTGERGAFAAAALYALAPAPALFLPSLDAIYAVSAALMLALWQRALAPGRPTRAAALLAFVLWATFATAYNLLPLGGLMVAAALREVLVEARDLRDERRSTLARGLRSAAIALGGWCALMALVWLATGFEPIAAFRRSLALQAEHAQGYDRRWIQCVVFDPLDFLRGAGWITLAPVVAAWALAGRPPREGDADEADDADDAGRRAWLVRAWLLFVVAVDLSGLLRAETMRVWTFLLPLWFAVAATPLARLPRRWWGALLALQWLGVVAMRARMGFVGFGTD